MPFRLALFLGLALPTFGQRFEWRGTLVNRQNSTETIAFATAWIPGKNHFFSADETGTLTIRYDDYAPTDSLRVACIGYEAASFSCREVFEKRPGALALNAVAIQLPAVLVRNRKGKTETWGGGRRIRSYVSCGQGNQAAVFFPNPNGAAGLLHRVNYFTAWMGGKPAHTPFRVRLYAADPQTGAPGNDLLPETLIVTPRRNNRWVSVDVTQYGISVPETGFFAALEFLPAEVYVYPTGFAPFLFLGSTNALPESRSWNWSPQKGWQKMGLVMPGAANYLMAAEVVTY
jgi:hypothetical protein